jgi:acyl carrier protein
MTPADVFGWDSLKHINIIMEVERRLARVFEPADLDQMLTVGDFVRLIAQN